MKFAAAQNAAIIEDNGMTVTYHQKCPYCGYINTSLKASATVMDGSRASLGSVPCIKCHKFFEIAISRR